MGPPSSANGGATETSENFTSKTSSGALARPVPFDELGDFTTVNRRTLYLSVVAVAIGVCAAFVADALLKLIGFFTNLFYYGRLSLTFVSPAGNSLGLLAVGVPIVGGLLVGLMARFGSERIRGHGIPEALESILIHKSRIEPKMAVLKPVSAAISIGAGGPFGAEGPIIMTGGALGSTFGQALHLSAAERKTLLVAGAAGGMAATFNTPVAAVLLAVELLLFEWRPRSLLPVAVSSVVATLTRWPLLGTGALFPLPESPLPTVPLAFGALIVGLGAGVLATVLTFAVYGFEDLFRRLPVHWVYWPAIGGAIVGVGGLLDPRALGVGYDTIDLLLVGGLGLSAVLLLLAVKGIIWSASLGSGTSGGVLAPLLMMGAATGSLIGSFLPWGSPALWAVIALGAVLGGSMRVPFTGVLFALELTNDLNLLLPLLVACVAAEGVTVFTLRRSILTEKVARRRVHTAREYAVDPLEVMPIRAVMHTDLVPTPARSPIGDVARLGPEYTSKYVGFPLLSEQRRLVGFATREDVATYLAEGGDPARPILEIGAWPAQPLDPDQPVRMGVAWLAELDARALPVVDPRSPEQVVGMLTRDDLFEARVLALDDEVDRDRTIHITLPTLRLARGPLGGGAPPAKSPRVPLEPPGQDEDIPPQPT